MLVEQVSRLLPSARTGETPVPPKRAPPMARLATVCLLALILGVAACQKAGTGGTGGTAGGGGGGGGTEHFRFRPEGGSTTILGKARDRALDAEMGTDLA